MLTADEASDLCEFLADFQEEIPCLLANIDRFLPGELRRAVRYGFFGVQDENVSGPVEYSVGRWLRERFG